MGDVLFTVGLGRLDTHLFGAQTYTAEVLLWIIDFSLLNARCSYGLLIILLIIK
jgi:hypothetical protein